MNIKTPVAFLIFNRPDTTAKVFEAIRQAKPPKLLVVADGPRSDRPDEAEKCKDTREIIKQVDWDCEVLTNYSDVNLGCGIRVSTGLNWVFEQVEEAIILEDDCLPDATFFRFCEELLDVYRNDTRIMHISGTNFHFRRHYSKYSYYFSLYPNIWGWASWRRAWQCYDFAIKLWPQFKNEGCLNTYLHNKKSISYWSKIFQSVYDDSQTFNTWDYQWFLSCWIQNGLSIVPSLNLVSNIGFGSAATHTKGVSPFANLPLQQINFPQRHPPFLIRDMNEDIFTQTNVFDTSLLTRLNRKLKFIQSK
jgi:hypothetical protein